MENQIPTVPTQPIVNTQQTTIPEQPKKSNFLTILLSTLLFLAIVIAVFFAYQTQKLSNELNTLKLEPESTFPMYTEPNESVEDSSTGWEMYINPVENFSFKYPSTWIIDKQNEMGDEREENIQIGLIKDTAQIKLYADLVGIGGMGQNYTGKPFILDENNLFIYKKLNTYDSTQEVGITDSLTESLGVFMLGSKTYSLTLSYPINFSQTEADKIEKEFDQILSTFKFNN